MHYKAFRMQAQCRATCQIPICAFDTCARSPCHASHILDSQSRLVLQEDFAQNIWMNEPESIPSVKDF